MNILHCGSVALRASLVWPHGGILCVEFYIHNKNRKANPDKMCSVKRHGCQCTPGRHQGGIYPVAAPHLGFLINQRRRSRSHSDSVSESGSHSTSTRRDTNRRRQIESGRRHVHGPLGSHIVALRGEQKESRRRRTRGISARPRGEDQHKFTTSSRIRRRTRGILITGTTRRQGEFEHEVSGACVEDKPREGPPREWATGDATKEIATNAPHDRERHEEKHPTKGRKVPRGWRSGRGDSGEAHKYILSKVAVSCEGDQSEKARRGIPPPGLFHPPWDNPTSIV